MFWHGAVEGFIGQASNKGPRNKPSAQRFQTMNPSNCTVFRWVFGKCRSVDPVGPFVLIPRPSRGISRPLIRSLNTVASQEGKCFARCFALELQSNLLRFGICTLLAPTSVPPNLRFSTTGALGLRLVRLINISPQSPARPWINSAIPI